MLKTKMLGATAAPALPIEDVFSTYLYTGNGSTQTITNGIDLAGEGGLVWQKNRVNAAYDHNLFDTARGVTKKLITNGTFGNITETTYLTAFNSNGFSMGSDAGYNKLNEAHVSWTFRKAPRFFDVVTYTGNGTSQNISHNLGVAPGCIIIKRTDSTSNWITHHRGSGGSNYLTLRLNETAANLFNVGSGNFTGTQFLVANWGTTTTGVANDNTNVSGGTYVAYLFAHDPLGPSGDGSDGLIACGSFTTDGSGNATVDLGWEPQWGLFKASNDTSNWSIVDNMRGWLTDLANQKPLYANLSNAESSGSNFIRLNATGFSVTNNALGTNKTYIYIAIRRGPMREPTSGTQVLGLNARAGNAAAGVTVTGGLTTDAFLVKNRGSAVDDLFAARLTNTGYLSTNISSAEIAAGSNILQANPWDVMDGVKIGSTSTIVNASGSTYINYLLRRAPGFFDVVAYTGTGANRTVSHNLGVVPELMIVKVRSSSPYTYDWGVYAASLGPTKYLMLNSTAGAGTYSGFWNDTSPTSSVFTVGNENITNNNTSPIIAYLFATLPGVSKVGSYTGNGSSQTINCGFTGGARFVLIKRTDAADAWYVWDTARGIVSGNDPYLQLNSNAAEVTSSDHIDPDNSGFALSTSFAGTNQSGGSYIFLAIA